MLVEREHLGLLAGGGLANVRPEVLGEVEAKLQFGLWPPRAILFAEGQPARGLFFLRAGEVILSKGTRDGKSIMLRAILPTCFFGLSSAVLNGLCPVSASTATHCEIGWISTSMFRKLQQRYHDVSAWAAEQLALELHTAWEHTMLLAAAVGNEAKLAYILLLLGGEPHTRSPRGPAIISMTQDEIAAAVGASRETVNRLLGTFRERGLIRTMRGSICIVRPQQLLSLAGAGSCGGER